MEVKNYIPLAEAKALLEDRGGYLQIMGHSATSEDELTAIYAKLQLFEEEPVAFAPADAPKTPVYTRTAAQIGEQVVKTTRRAIKRGK